MANDLVSSAEFEKLLLRCQSLPQAQGNYLINDYVENVLLTVVDYQMHTTTVVRAMEHYKNFGRAEIRTHQNLVNLLASYPDTNEGNGQAAQYLWGYNFWSRIELLRRLLHYLETIGVTTQEQLHAWARETDFANFQGKVKGIGFAIFKWLVMRQGVETIKPDVWIHRFVQDSIGRSVRDETAVLLLEQAAQKMSIKAYELDWRIWEYQRRQPANAHDV